MPPKNWGHRHESDNANHQRAACCAARVSRAAGPSRHATPRVKMLVHRHLCKTRPEPPAGSLAEIRLSCPTRPDAPGARCVYGRIATLRDATKPRPPLFAHAKGRKCRERVWHSEKSTPVRGIRSSVPADCTVAAGRLRDLHPWRVRSRDLGLLRPVGAVLIVARDRVARDLDRGAPGGHPRPPSPLTLNRPSVDDTL
ncbi:MAG: hypothetical protein QOH28_1859 [Actinomycetota bacterium]|nr:hypothetical protein [Actinomycetota bacterium]